MKTSLLAGLAGLALIAAAAESRPREQVVTAQVSFADLDLSSQAGITELGRRVNRAASELCTGNWYRVGVSSNLPEPRCRASALASAREQMQLAISEQANPRLAARATLVISGR